MTEPSEDIPDEELVRLVLAGRVELYADIYRRYRARTHRLAFGMTGRRETAEDLTQEIFMRAYQRLGQFREESKFSTWFYRLAVNHCLTFRAKSARDLLRAAEAIEGAHALRAPDRPDGSLRDEVHRALLTLAPEPRMIVILRDVEGLSYQEIAERMNCSEGTIASRLNRARRALAARLEHWRGHA